jgi:hypothetical protein
VTAALETHPPARAAGPELLVLAEWETAVAWLLGASARWPKSARFTLTQRLENHALDVLEMLVQARYQPGSRRRTLEEANLRLERMRFLLRIARGAGACAAPCFEGALRRIDETGRMIHGWRSRLAAGRAAPRSPAPPAACGETGGPAPAGAAATATETETEAAA